MSDRPEGYRIDKDIFRQRYNLTEETLQKAGIEWSLLEQIHARHSQMTRELQSAADYVSGRLQLVPTVHSLKVRIKNAEHLLEKIIRKKSKSPDVSFDCTSYESLITDLIGIRALHFLRMSGEKSTSSLKKPGTYMKNLWPMLEKGIRLYSSKHSEMLVAGLRSILSGTAVFTMY